MSSLISRCFFFDSPLFEEDVSEVWDYENSVEQYTAEGGTSRVAVQEQVTKLKQWIDAAKL